MSEEKKLGRILLVDDEETILRAWSRALQKEGCQVTTAASGREALEVIKERPFDVIFSDMKMPGVSGLEFLGNLRRLGFDGCVNIVTGMPNITDVVECMRQGACDYVQKPCDLSELLAKAARCLGHAAERRQRKKLENEVMKYEEIDRLKFEFVSNVSHELRTPLFSMKGAFDLLRGEMGEGLSSDPVRSRLVDIVRSNIERLSRVVGNVLDFSRLERGVLAPHFESVDLAVLANESMGAMTPLFAEKNIKLEPLQLSGSAEVSADPNHLRQVFINLLGNAVKFTKPGGSVGIKITGKEEAVEIVIRDNGIGITPQNQQKIFERFYQVDASLTREAGGTGIGLSLVKAVIENHKGKIWVESAPGQGSRFCFVLPRNPACVIGKEAKGS
ncbi:MAG: response regulator [Elusimicrobia bacterium]|nr:response regulator [Elusimicrobiota bacterium]